MGEFQSLGTMDRHQANCIFGFVHLKRDDASRLAEVFQVVDELFEIGCLINLLFFPIPPQSEEQPAGWEKRNQAKIDAR